MPKAIVFDIGGVLIGLNMGRCIEAFRSGLGFERITQLLDPYHQKGIYGELEGGRLSEQHFKDLVIAESRPGTKPEDVEWAMGELLEGKMDPRSVQAVKNLAGKYPLYLLTNNNPISIRLCHGIFKDNGIDPETVFKEEFISSDLKMLKPDPEFYKYVIRKIGLEPHEILFIDDNKPNVDGARALGIDARQYIPGTDLGLILSDC